MRVTKALLSVFLISVIACEFAAAAKKDYHVPPEIAEKVVEQVLTCVSKMGLDSSIINLLKEGRYYEDNKLIEALLCADEKLGFGNANGRVNVDKVMNDLFANKPEIRSALEACEKDYGKNPVENFKTFLLCFKDKSPVRVLL